jgi:UDP-hydrolysing UDP-N-acetyl-D-glucosamine 2-epimerase
MHKIAALTLGRLDWNIWKPILSCLKKKKNINLNLIALGLHFEKKFGLSYKTILKDGYQINQKMKIVYKKSNAQNLSDQFSMYVNFFSKIFLKNNFDFLILIGDRFETLSAACTAVQFKIPVIHIHGGEISKGSFDELYRHATTKMSHIHYVSNNVYKKRIIQMGEEKWRIKVIGSPSLDNLLSSYKLEKNTFCKKYLLDSKKKIILVSFNSESINYEKTSYQIETLLKVLSKKKKYNILITLTNYDANSDIINKRILFYEKKFSHIKSVKYLGSDYASALSLSHFVIGNSSSGIIETSSFKIPTINLGERQLGRIIPQNVINCPIKFVNIDKAIKKCNSKLFRKKVKVVKNPFRYGSAGIKFIKHFSQVLKMNKEKILKKNFKDIKF